MARLSRPVSSSRSACRISPWRCLRKRSKSPVSLWSAIRSNAIRILRRTKSIAACRKAGMAVVAYSPIARGGAKGDRLMEQIGKGHGKTAAQVCLRWLTQQSIVVIPRTSKVERLTENLNILDFDLSDAEMKEIAGLARPGGRIVDWSWSPKWD
ncbi:MAG: aldo/keto reductase [Pseudolabrys sp.]